MLPEKEPAWQAYVSKNISTGTNALLIPLKREGVKVEVPGNRMVPFGSLNYLVMYKDSSNNIMTEWVVLRPSGKWITAKGKAKFDGVMLIKDWEGNVKRAFSFEDGVGSTYSRAQGQENSPQSKKKSSGTARTGQDCSFVTKYYVVRGETCPCGPKHTHNQLEKCKCIIKPTPDFSVPYETEECTMIPDIPNDGGGDSEENPGNDNGNGGTPTPDDYTPLDCNPDPNYVMPTTPPPAGEAYLLPCSALDVDPTPGVDVPEPPTAANTLVNIYSGQLSASEISFLYDPGNSLIVDGLLDYIFVEDAPELFNIGRWAIAEFTYNRITWQQFQNWFILTYPGVEPEGNYSESYWLTVNFPKQNLPTYISLNTNFPERANIKESALLDSIGGQVKTDLAKYLGLTPPLNTCALRLSYALLKSGINIPNIPDPTGGGRHITLPGKDGKYYFLRAEEMDEWMQITFGTKDGKAYLLTGAQRNVPVDSTHIRIDRSQILPGGTNLDSLVTGKQGIYSLKSYIRRWASGHVDILRSNATTDGGPHFDGPIQRINIWQLD